MVDPADDADALGDMNESSGEAAKNPLTRC
jgi:hypothetical protein